MNKTVTIEIPLWDLTSPIHVQDWEDDGWGGYVFGGLSEFLGHVDSRLREPNDADPLTNAERQSYIDGLDITTAEPERFTEIDPIEHYYDILPEDWAEYDLPDPIRDAFRSLNEAIRACTEPAGYFPGTPLCVVLPQDGEVGA